MHPSAHSITRAWFFCSWQRRVLSCLQSPHPFQSTSFGQSVSNSNPCLFSVPVFYPPQVLRFYAMWDDTTSMFGENRPYVIHYYLADDTVEVREVHKHNDGRDPFPVLIKRQRLPKTFVEKKSKFRPASTSACAKVPQWVGVDVEAVSEIHQVWSICDENTASIISFWPKKSSFSDH